MTRTSLAPLLWATRRRDSCWIIGRPRSRFAAGSLRPLQHLYDPPALELGRGSGLLHADAVADVDVVGLVVHVEPLRAVDELGVLGMAHALDHGDDGGLVHLVRHDHAVADLAGVAGVGPGGGIVGHQRAFPSSTASAAAISRCRMWVLMRAICRRTRCSSDVLSSCPVALRSRSLKWVSLAMASSPSSWVRSSSARSPPGLGISTSPRAR